MIPLLSPTLQLRDDLAVIEYLIRTVEGHELPPTQGRDLADMLLPAGFNCEQIDGWGDFRMRCGTTEVSSSAEDPGWQVSFEGTMAEPRLSLRTPSPARRAA